MRQELVALLDVLRDRVRLETRPIDQYGIVPIYSHATYALYELMAAYGLISKGSFARIARGPRLG